MTTTTALQRMTFWACCAAGLLSVAGCKEEQAADVKGEVTISVPTAVPSSPTREGVVARLKEIQKQLKAGSFDALRDQFAVPKGQSEGALPEQLKQLAERVSDTGVEALAAKGKWAPLAEAFDKPKVEPLVQRFGIGVDRCWTLIADQAEVVLCRFADGKDRFIRIHGITRLETGK